MTSTPPDEETLVDLPPLDDEDDEIVMNTAPAAPPPDDSADRIIDETHIANEKALARLKQRQYLGWSFRDMCWYGVVAVLTLFILAMLLVALGLVHANHRPSYFEQPDDSSSSSTGG
jgi:hypothetical protein